MFSLNNMQLLLVGWYSLPGAVLLGLVSWITGTEKQTLEVLDNLRKTVDNTRKKKLLNLPPNSENNRQLLNQ